MIFSPAQLARVLSQVPPVRRYWIAYSGGADSHVLLHALAALRDRLNGAVLQAVHVHHGLHADAERWVAHCRAICTALEVELQVLRVDARPGRGQSPEAAAREARYGALRHRLEAGDALVTAHHQEDQAETLLLQLLRGSGPRGLAAMPESAVFGAGLHLRPLLGFSRQALRDYARCHELAWVEDSSNAALDYHRNYLRHEILPRLRTQWPAASATMARAAGHSAEAAELLNELAAVDLRAAGVDEAAGCLSVSVLLGLPAARRRNVLRFWLQGLGLPVPSSAQLERLQEDVLRAAADAEPCARWPGAEVRRYRDRLYAMAPLAAPDRRRVLAWDLNSALVLPDGCGRLAVHATTGGGLKADLPHGGAVTIRFRQGGERCRPAGRRETHALKKLLQERGVPPWQRARMPLIYVDGQLAAVADLWACEPFASAAGEPGLRIEWQPGAGPTSSTVC